MSPRGEIENPPSQATPNDNGSDLSTYTFNNLNTSASVVPSLSLSGIEMTSSNVNRFTSLAREASGVVNNPLLALGAPYSSEVNRVLVIDTSASTYNDPTMSVSNVSTTPTAINHNTCERYGADALQLKCDGDEGIRSSYRLRKTTIRPSTRTLNDFIAIAHW